MTKGAATAGSRLMLQGADEADNFPKTSANKARFFVSGYERRVLPRVAHFIPREAPNEVLTAIRQLMSTIDAGD